MTTPPIRFEMMGYDKCQLASQLTSLIDFQKLQQPQPVMSDSILLSVSNLLTDTPVGPLEHPCKQGHQQSEVINACDPACNQALVGDGILLQPATLLTLSRQKTLRQELWSWICTNLKVMGSTNLKVMAAQHIHQQSLSGLAGCSYCNCQLLAGK